MHLIHRSPLKIKDYLDCLPNYSAKTNIFQKKAHSSHSLFDVCIFSLYSAFTQHILFSLFYGARPMSSLPRHNRFEAAYAVWTYVRQRNNFLDTWHNHMQLPAVQAYVTLKRDTVKRMVLEGINAHDCLPDERSPAHMVKDQFFTSFRRIAETYTDPTLADVTSAIQEPNEQFFVLLVIALRDDGWVDATTVDKVIHAYTQLPVHKRMEVTEALIRTRFLPPDDKTFSTYKSTWKTFIDYALRVYKDYRLVPE